MKILKFIKRSAMAALAATMLMGTMQPMQVLAAEDLTLEVDIDKKLDIPLTLDASTDDFYMNANINPGDILNAEVVFKNESKEDIQVRISDVKDQLSTTMSAKLLDILDLNIDIDGKTAYKGSHAKVTNPLTQWITLKGGEELTMKVRIEFPKYEADNTFQGAEMKVKYVFEARADIPEDQTTTSTSTSKSTEKIKTGVDDVESSNKMAVMLVVGAVVVLGGFGVATIVMKKRREDEEE